MPTGALIGSAVVGAGTSLVGANMQKQATDKASKVAQQQYQQTRADLSPYRTAGEQGTNMLMSRLSDLTAPISFDQQTLQNLPGYQFALQQGLKSTQSGAAARGLGKSGAAVKGATNFATGTANQYYGDYYNRELAQRNQAYNQLMGTAQLGANAAAQTGQYGTQTAQQIGSNTIGGANALAAGLTGAGNALTTGANSYAGYNLAQQQLGNNTYQNMWARNGTGAY